MAEWAGWRWAGPISFFLGVASPPGLGASPARTAAAVRAGGRGRGHGRGDGRARSRSHGGSCHPVRRHDRAPTSADERSDRPGAGGRQRSGHGGPHRRGLGRRPFNRLGRAPLRPPRARRGYPATIDWAESRAGWPIVVGSRAASWTGLGHLAAALVLDAHDESYREESAPTYSAVDVVTERCRREGSPCVLTLPVPPGGGLHAGRALETLPALGERSGWSVVDRVDRREQQPRTGMFSEEFGTPGPIGARRPPSGRATRTAGVFLPRPDRSGPPAGLRRLWRAGAVHVVSGRGRPGCVGIALPPLRERAAARRRGLRTHAHEDVAGRGIPSPGGGGGSAGCRGGRGFRAGPPRRARLSPGLSTVSPPRRS